MFLSWVTSKDSITLLQERLWSTLHWNNSTVEESTVQTGTELLWLQRHQACIQTESVPDSKNYEYPIFKPMEDWCNVCLSYSFGLRLQQEYNIHMKRKQQAQDNNKKDRKLAEDDSTVLIITIDLQVVLLVQKLFANANYYKTKLCCHNFTMYEFASPSFGMRPLETL